MAEATNVLKLPQGLTNADKDRLQYWHEAANKLGLSLIPLKGSNPVESDWLKYCKTKRHFNIDDFIEHNAGIACGPASGILAVEITDYELFGNWLKKQGYWLPDTMYINVCEKCFFYLFRYSSECSNFKIADSVNFLRVLWAGEYIPAPYSVSSNTGMKVTKLGKHIADAPQWLIDNLEPISAGETTVRENAESVEQGQQQKVMPPAKQPVEKKPVIDLLLEINSFNHTFKYFGKSYAKINVKGHFETHDITSSAFKWYLKYQCRTRYKKLAKEHDVKEAIDHINSKAYFESKDEPVYTRVAHYNGSIFIDLGNPQWEIVEINPVYQNGWRVITSCDVNFLRDDDMLPLPRPEPGGSIDEFREVINCPDDSSWKMLVGWMLGALQYNGGIPVLIVTGEHGTAKTTLTELLQSNIDPSNCDKRAFPKSEVDLYVSASSTWLQAFDNISGCSKGFSNALCRLSTGGSFTTRKLYTNNEKVTFKLKRPVILNGINNMASKPDLLDRAVVVQFKHIPSARRMTDSELIEKFNEMQPRILGALYSAAACALKNKDSIMLPGLPRMADFTKWVTAAEPALGWESGSFYAEYEANRDIGIKLSIEDSELAKAMIALMESRYSWKGYANGLLSDLRKLDRVTDEVKHSPSWPKDESALSRKLNELAPILRAEGIEYNSKTDRYGCFCTIKKNASGTFDQFESDSQEDR